MHNVPWEIWEPADLGGNRKDRSGAGGFSTAVSTPLTSAAMMMSRRTGAGGLAQAEDRMRREAWSQKGPACPQPSQTTPRGRQGVPWSRGARGRRAALPGWVRQGPPLRHGSHQTLHFNQRHSAHCSRVAQASVQLLTRCPGIFWAFIKWHHALTFPQPARNAPGWHSAHACGPWGVGAGNSQNDSPGRHGTRDQPTSDSG